MKSCAGVLMCCVVLISTSSTRVLGQQQHSTSFAEGLQTDYKALKDSDITLRCSVANLAPGDTIVWLRGRQAMFVGQVALVFDPRLTLLVDKAVEPQVFDLKIERVNNDDLGIYTCRINRQPPIDLLMELELQLPVSLTLTTPAEVTKVKGQYVTLGCEADGIPYPTVTWTTIDGGELPDGMEVFEGRELKLVNLTREHDGVYQCQGSNGLGEPQQKEIRLHINYPPEVVIEKAVVHSSGEGRPGEEASLRCRFVMRPMGTAAWWKQTYEVMPGMVGDHSRIVSEVVGDTVLTQLTVASPTPDDLSTYTCIGRNALGEVRGDVLLTGIPHEVQILSKDEAASHHKYKLKWSALSQSELIDYEIKLEYYNASVGEVRDWSQPFVVASRGSGVVHEYTVEGLAPDTRYTVTVQARNRYGTTQGHRDFTTPPESGDASSGATSSINIATTIVSLASVLLLIRT